MPAARWEQFTPKLFTVLARGYSAADLRADALSGLTVAIVALPLAMALGIASGASPDKGLVTAIVAGFLVSFLGGSRVQIGGPTGAFVVVVFNVIAQHGYDGLVLATLLAGVILVVAGYAKLGQIIRFIPEPVITGFTAGIAVIIATSQVKDFLGLQIADVPADFVPKWMVYVGAMNTVSIAALGIGLGSLTLILLLRRFAPKIPGYLAAVIMASVAVSIFQLPVETIGSRFPDIPSGLPMPTVPEITFLKIQEVLPSAFTIAFLAGIEALLSAVVADGMTGFRHRSNQELVAQGAANVASAFFGGLPATGAIARTATNIKSGGRSPVSGILHALFVLIFMLYGTDLMKYVPMTTLAAILFMVAWGMSEVHRFMHLLKMPSHDRGVLLLTFSLTVLVDLTVAIGVGVILASLLFMMHMSKTVEIRTGDASHDEQDQRVALPPGVEVFRIAGPFFFGVANELLDILRRIGRPPKVFILRLRLVPFLDTSGVTALEKFVGQCRVLGIQVIFSGAQSQPLELLKRAGLGAGGIVHYAPGYAAALTLAEELIKSD